MSLMEMERIIQTKEPLSKIGVGLASRKSTLGESGRESDSWIADRFEKPEKLVTDFDVYRYDFVQSQLGKRERPDRELLENAKTHAAFWIRQIRLRTVEKNPGPVQEQPEIVTPQQRAQAVVEVLVEFLECTGFVRDGFSTAGDVAQWTEWIMDGGDWMKVCKYKIAAFYQYAQRDLLVDKTLPKSPFSASIKQHPLHLLGGRAGRYIRAQIRKTNPNRQEFLSSLLLVKGGMPLPDKPALKKAKKATEAVLTTPRVKPWKHQPVVVPGLDRHDRRHGITSMDQLVKEVVRTTKEAFRGKRFTTKDLLTKPITPSFSANYINNREGHGSFGTLYEKHAMFGYLPRRHLRSSRVPVEEYIGLDNDLDVVMEGFDAARDQFLHTYFGAARAARDELPIAKAVPLAEALKVRVITKGPPLTQYCLQPVQQFMKNTLKNHPAFELIGGTGGTRPVTPEMVNVRMGRLLGNQAFLSGDYSDATNQLNPELSEAAWTAMCDACDVPRILRELGLRVLTGHHVVVGKDKKTSEDRTMPQVWGQLMGSIISFPILCLINAAICRMSIEYDRDETLSLSDCPLMVNGDDCLLRVTPLGYAAWNTFGTMAGLAPSVGKVYFSREFCNINSVTFVYTERDIDEIAFTYVKTLRLGLVFGNKRSQAEVDLNKLPALELAGGDMTIGSRHVSMLRECPDRWKLKAHMKFLSKNSKALSFATEHQIPWYVPLCYGGVGLQPLPELGSFDMTVIDKKIITAMVQEATWNPPKWNEAEGRFDWRPAPMPKKPMAASDLATRSVALQELRRLIGDVPYRWVPESDSSRDGLDSPALNWWVLYQRPELVIADDIDMSMKVVLHNQRTWNWYFKHLEDFAWMQVSDIRPKRQVHDVRIFERRPAVLPTRQEMAIADVDNFIIREVEGEAALFGSYSNDRLVRSTCEEDSLSRYLIRGVGSVHFCQ